MAVKFFINGLLTKYHSMYFGKLYIQEKWLPTSDTIPLNLFKAYCVSTKQPDLGNDNLNKTRCEIIKKRL